MCRLAILLSLAVLSAAQYKPSPETAAIISDSRYLAGDGTFGSAYTQEDGVQFKEESDAAGNRKGSYSYIDPSGQRRTVTYTAGKNGFQAFGDHLPVPPPAPPAPQVPQGPHVQPQYQPAQYQPQPYYQQPQVHYPAPHPGPSVQANYQSAAVGSQPQYDDGQYREEYNDPNYKSPVAPQVPRPSSQYSYSFGASPTYAAVPGIPQQYAAAGQPNAHRFFAPGKLNLNRTPDGFSYTFNKS